MGLAKTDETAQNEQNKLVEAKELYIKKSNLQNKTICEMRKSAKMCNKSACEKNKKIIELKETLAEQKLKFRKYKQENQVKTVVQEDVRGVAPAHNEPADHNELSEIVRDVNTKDIIIVELQTLLANAEKTFQSDLIEAKELYD